MDLSDRRLDLNLAEDCWTKLIKKKFVSRNLNPGQVFRTELFSALQSFVPDIHWQHLDCTDVFLRIQQQLSTPVPNRAKK